MDKINCFEYCNFKKHLNDNLTYTHFCHTCKLRLCSECVLLHNNDSNLSKHSLENISTDLQKSKILIEEVGRDKNIKNFYESNKNEKVKLANSLLNNFKDLMINTNNKFSKMLSDYTKNYYELENIKKNVVKRLNDENFNFESEIKKFEEKTDETYLKMKSIDEIYNFTMNYIINRENKNNNDNQLKIEQCNNINKSIIHKKEIVNNNNINEIFVNKDKSNNNLNKQDNKMLLEESKNENLKLNEPKIVTNNFYTNELTKKEETSQSQNKIITKLKINLNKEKALNNSISYINRKKRRDYNINNEYNKLKEPKFTFGDNTNPKKELEDININTNIDKNKSGINLGKDKIIFRQINNYKTNINNIYLGKDNISSNKKEIQDKSDEIVTIFNFKLNREGEVSISLNVNIGNVFMIKSVESNDVIYENPFYRNKFPYFGSRLINISNKAFVIGGKSLIEEKVQGNKLVFKLEYINNKEIKDSGEIRCICLKDMIFEHAFHHLVYSEIYNIIFVISGRNQRKCEYGILDKNKESIIEWKELDSVRNPRENDLCFLLNEHYIFLLGEKNDLKYNYEVFDISNIFKGGKWKIYNFIPNNNNIGIFGLKIPGVIEVRDNVYILGGYQHGIGNNLNWKIYFSSDERDKEDKEYKRIESIINLKSEKIKKYGGILSFYGQQKFMKFQDSFININILGNHVKFSKNQLDEKL